MSTDSRKTFLDWHKQKVETEEIFDFHTEILEYCRSDVNILLKACLSFRNMLMDITGKPEVTMDERTGDMVERMVGGIDPFNEITITSVCSKVFRTKFLTETWQVRLRLDGNMSDWVPAEKKDGDMKVQLNGEWLEGEELQRRDYIIEESRFVSSPLAQVPSNVYVVRDQFSRISIQWLEWMMECARRRCKPFFIHHALNGGEVRLPGTQYRLDGFQVATPEQYVNGIKGTAYEFLGCYWHGCPECYRGTDRQKKTPRTNQSMNELHALTLKKQAYIESQGMKYVHIWECEFQRELHNQPSAMEFVSILDIQDRLEPRDSFFGGRTNATKLRYEVKEEEKVHYVDFTSLYPYVNKYCEYPLKEPHIITRDFKDIGQYFGIAKVKVLPPKGLYHPVLPQKCNGKLTFALCRTCAEIQSQKPCQCNDDARSMVGTWCTLELIKAREKGYKILKIYEVYHWDHTSQYDHHSGNGGIFEGYINLFLKIKQEASDWPTWVKTEDINYQQLPLSN